MLGNRWPHKPPLGYRLDSEHPLALDLVSFWALNEGTGLPFDLAGQALATSGSATWAAGQNGGSALAFNGSQSVNVGSSGIYNAIAGSPITIAFFANCASTTFQVVWGGAPVTPSGLGFAVGFSQAAAGTLNYYNGNGSNTWRSSTNTPLISGSWHTYAVTQASTAANSLYFYRDGLQQGSGVSASAYPTASVSSHTIGAYPGGTNPWTGTLGWLGIWSRALSVAEHAALANWPWQIFTPRRTQAYFGPLTVAFLGYTVTGPSHGITGVASSNFTVAPSAIIASDTVTLSDGGGAGAGTFTPSSLTFTTSMTAQHFTYTPGSTGVKTIALTSAASHLLNPTSLTYTSNLVPVSFTLTPPSVSSYTAGVPSPNFTLVPDSAATDTITFSDGGAGGAFTPSSLSFAASAASQTFTYTPATAGNKTITLTSADSATIRSSPATLNPVVAIGFTLSGPSSGVGLATSSAFTLAPASATNDVVTLSDGKGGTFAPSSFAFTVASTASQTFTYTPASVGPKTIAATSTDGATIAAIIYNPTPVPGSIRFTNQCSFSTGSNNLLASVSQGTVAFRVQFNTLGGAGMSTFGFTNLIGKLVGSNYVSWMSFDGNATIGNFNANLGMSGSTGSISAAVPIQTGVPYHVAISWSGTGTVNQTIYVNGAPIAKATVAYSTYNYTGALCVGPTGTMPVDYQLSDLAIWDTYAANQSDVAALYYGTSNPLTLGTPASAWFPLSGTAPHPTYTDQGFLDWAGGGYTFTGTSIGSNTTATYAGALGYAPLLETSAYVSKSGKLALFFPVSTVPATNGYYPPQPVTSVPSNPTITWNGQAIEADGPVWGDTSQNYHFAAYRLQCGTVESIGITNGGTVAYTAPTVAITGGGGGSGLALGAPTLNTGILAYTLTGVGSYGQYTSLAAVAMAGGTYITAPSARSVLTGSTLTVVPTVGGLLGCGGSVSVAPTFTLSGAVGTGAKATATLTGGVAFATVTAGGSGYTSATVSVAITDSSGPGTGATATATITAGAVTAITITAAGSGYVTPAIAISDSRVGTGATATGTPWKAGGITMPLVTAGGTNYAATGTTAAVSGGGGSGATVVVTVVGGVVTAVTPTALGINYTSNPTITISGTGTGATATTTWARSGGIAAVAVTAGGSGYSTTTTTAYAIDTQDGIGSGATLGIVVNASGVVTAIAPTAAGTGYTHPVVAIQPGTGSGAKATVTLTGGAVSGFSGLTGGSGYGLNTTATVNDPTGTGAVLAVTVSGEAVTAINVTTAGSGYTNPTLIITDGAQVGVTATIGQYIQSWAITNGGSGYTSPPTLTVSDATGSGAILTPVMSGASSGDTLTYTAPWGWLLCGLGGVVASPPPGSFTPGDIVNFAGSTEGPAGLLAGFPTTKTMKLGLNAGSEPTYNSSSVATFRNYMKRVDQTFNGWTGHGTTAPTVTIDGEPISWATGGGGAYISCIFYAVGGPNDFDSKGIPSLMGTWTIIYDDSEILTYPATVTITGDSTNVKQIGSTAYSTAGSTVTVSAEFQYISSTPPGWGSQLTMNVSQANGQWNLSNVFIIPPNNTVSRTPALAMDDNVVNWLTTPNSQTPAAIRFMDVCAYYAGVSNCIDATDLQSPDAFSWGNPYIANATTRTNTPAGTYGPSGTPQIISARAYITDPTRGSTASGGDGTYDWTISGKLYLSSVLAQWGSSGADASGACGTGTYLTLPATVGGNYMLNPTEKLGNYCAVELVTASAHGLRTGQLLIIVANQNNSIPQNIPVITASGLTYFDIAGGFIVFVTGPTTFAIYVSVQSLLAPTGLMLQVDSTSTFTAGSETYGELQIPYGGCVPFEFAAASCSQLGCDVWISVPTMASDACSAAIASRVAANLTPGLKVYVEYANEHWNYAQSNYYRCSFLSGLMGYFPALTSIGNYYKTTGSAINVNSLYTIRTATHHDIWEGVFAALGRGGDVIRVFGTQFGAGTTSQQMVGTATQLGIPMDSLATAPYYSVSADLTMQAACTPAGGAVPVNAPGNWPMDAMLDVYKHSVYYNQFHWSARSTDCLFGATWGQPAYGATTALGASSGGSLVTGSYYASYTFVTSGGLETTVGNSQSAALRVPSAGYVLEVTLPELPTWATGINVYLTLPNQLPSTQVLYASLTTTSTPTSVSYTGTTTFNCIAPVTGTTAPPATNQVPPTHALPEWVAYEGSINNIVPTQMPFSNALARDAFYHPAHYDVHNVMFSAWQEGNPTQTGTGYGTACYFSLTNAWSNQVGLGIWGMAVSTAQLPGLGLSNQFGTAQGGAPADGAAHDLGNQLPALQAARDWWDAIGPPVLAVSSTTPASGAMAVSPSASITAIFSAPVASSSLSFAVATASGGVSLPGVASLDSTGTIATFAPSLASFAYSTGYTAVVSATGTDGVPMASSYTWSWTTASTPPTVSSTTPSSGATGVSPSAPITAIFSTPVASSSLSFAVATASGGVSLPGVASLDSTGTIATFAPSLASYAYSTGYTAVVSATGTDGVPMASSYTWSWTTASTPPTVSSTTPSSGATGVSPSAPITAIFSTPVASSSLSFAVATASGGVSLPGVASLDSTGTIATFAPSLASYAYSTGYTAVVSATGTDGVPMASSYTWSWTTASTPPTFTGGIPAVSFTFTSAIVATGLTITATAGGSNVPGTTSYNSSTYVATFTPAVPFTPGTKYILSIAGATTLDGTLMDEETITFTPGATAGTKGWFGGLGRPVMRTGS